MYNFPCDPEIAIVGMTIEQNGKTIETQLKPRKEAEEQYSDAIASGHSAFRASQAEEKNEIVLYLGQVLPHTQLVVKVRMVIQVSTLPNNVRVFQFPMDFIPQAYFKKADKSEN